MSPSKSDHRHDRDAIAEDQYPDVAEAEDVADVDVAGTPVRPSPRRALARRLRRAGRLVGLTADISADVEEIRARLAELPVRLDTVRDALRGFERGLRDVQTAGGVVSGLMEGLDATISFRRRWLDGISGQIGRCRERLMAIRGAVRSRPGSASQLPSAQAVAHELARTVERLDVLGLNCRLTGEKRNGPGIVVIADRLRRLAAEASGRMNTLASFAAAADGMLMPGHEGRGTGDGGMDMAVHLDAAVQALDAAAEAVRTVRSDIDHMAAAFPDPSVEKGDSPVERIPDFRELPDETNGLIAELTPLMERLDGVESVLATAAGRIAPEPSGKRAFDELAGAADDLAEIAELAATPLERILAVCRRIDTDAVAGAHAMDRRGNRLREMADILDRCAGDADADRKFNAALRAANRAVAGLADLLGGDGETRDDGFARISGEAKQALAWFLTLDESLGLLGTVARIEAIRAEGRDHEFGLLATTLTDLGAETALAAGHMMTVIGMAEAAHGGNVGGAGRTDFRTLYELMTTATVLETGAIPRGKHDTADTGEALRSRINRAAARSRESAESAHAGHVCRDASHDALETAEHLNGAFSRVYSAAETVSRIAGDLASGEAS